MSKERTILVVDDETSVRESLNEIFKDDYTVVMAQNGEEGTFAPVGKGKNRKRLDVELVYFTNAACYGYVIAGQARGTIYSDAYIKK